MPSVCFYFQVHQPYRMRPFHVFDIGRPNANYFDDRTNRDICRKVAEKCYLPANAMMLKLIKRYPGEFKIAYSISGVALEQFQTYTPEVVASFQKLAATGQVEFLAETYYHSLAALFRPEEFRAQVAKHTELMKKLFGVRPTTFRNTELIYSNAIAKEVADLGFTTMLTEGADHILKGKSPNQVYTAKSAPSLNILLKNYKLSDDIAFRFSDRTWKEWPLTPEKFAHWVHATPGEAVNLFMDYETFGEHQWAETGIFRFMEQLPQAIWQHPDYAFRTPTEVVALSKSIGPIDVPKPISWADTERDLSAWLGNPMQDASLAWIYRLADKIHQLDDPELLHTWRKLQTSDHFYYMCTKYWSDGDVHKYFSIYNAPHDAYVIMSNVLTDLEMRLEEPLKGKKRHKVPITTP